MVFWDRRYFLSFFKPFTNNLFFLYFQDALVQANDKAGYKGFKKQLSGRFKRLVSRKPMEPSPAIPPELKPQLKTIYVY